MTKTKDDASQSGESPSRLIDARITELGDWRGETLARIRSLIKQADPGVTEEWKWRGVPTWYHDGVICTGETYKPCQGDVRQGRSAEGSVEAVQHRPRRQRQTRHRPARRRQGQRRGLQGSRARGSGAEQLGEPELVRRTGRLRRRTRIGGSGQIVEHRLVGRAQPRGQKHPAQPREPARPGFRG